MFTLLIMSTLVNAQKVITYPVVVTFNSMCCGVPDNGPVINLIKRFKKQNKLKAFAVDSIGPMGREGEYYLAFQLKELSRAQRTRFIQQLRKIVPTMVDKGTAELKENETVNMGDLSASASLTVLKY